MDGLITYFLLCIALPSLYFRYLDISQRKIRVIERFLIE